jgi:hypothetical protein
MERPAFNPDSSHASAGPRLAAFGALALLALAWSAQPAHATTYTFQDIIDTSDPTFNQELGINSAGEIAGYFGSGAAGHPNQGYTTTSPYTSFTNENFTDSVQTQVTGINNIGTTVGFYSLTNMGVGLDSNFGFTDVGGTFTNVNNPNTATTPPTFNLGSITAMWPSAFTSMPPASLTATLTPSALARPSLPISTTRMPAR